MNLPKELMTGEATKLYDVWKRENTFKNVVMRRLYEIR